jgi:hypothetical protein
LATELQQKIQAARQQIQSKMNSGTSTATEGFDMIGQERDMQAGKRSNSIPVSDFMRQSSDVAPYAGSTFSESFALY